jgi:hypothetical protein
MKILLDFKIKVVREDIFKPTIGNESLHGIRHWVPFPSPITTRRAKAEIIRTRLHTLEGQSVMP